MYGRHFFQGPAKDNISAVFPVTVRPSAYSPDSRQGHLMPAGRIKDQNMADPLQAGKVVDDFQEIVFLGV